MSTSDEPKETNSENKTKGTDVDPAKVHSANSWETVDLGDDERKKKFLRLMGASKKEHHGKFVIGDHEPTHGRPKNETEHVNEELERQYNHSQEHKITRYSHTGLGFDDSSKTSTDNKPNSEKPVSKDEPEKREESSEGSKDSSSSSTIEKKRESTDTPDDTASPPKKPKMMMSFVKASD